MPLHDNEHNVPSPTPPEIARRAEFPDDTSRREPDTVSTEFDPAPPVA